nr:unnamed protein product [Spirometra erinaceieuropaei]
MPTPRCVAQRASTLLVLISFGFLTPSLSELMPPPRPISAFAISGTAIVVHWEEELDVAKALYLVQATADDQVEAICSCTTPCSNCTLVGLRVGTAYIVNMEACNDEMCTPSNYGLHATTVPGVPGPPTNVSVVLHSPTQAKIQWDPPEVTNGEIANYTAVVLQPYLYKCTFRGSDNGSCMLYDLIEGMTYYVGVCACNHPNENGHGGGCGQFSPQIPFTTWTGWSLAEPKHVIGIAPTSPIEGTYRNNTNGTWEVLVIKEFPNRTLSLPDMNFVLGDGLGRPKKSHLYNGALEPGTVYTVTLRLYFQDIYFESSPLVFRTKRRPVTPLIVFGTFGTLGVLVLLGFFILLACRRPSEYAMLLNESRDAGKNEEEDITMQESEWSHLEGTSENALAFRPVRVNYASRTSIPSYDNQRIPPVAIESFSDYAKRLVGNPNDHVNIQYRLLEILSKHQEHLCETEQFPLQQYWPDRGERTFSDGVRSCNVLLSGICNNTRWVSRILEITPLDTKHRWTAEQMQILSWSTKRNPRVDVFYELVQAFLEKMTVHSLNKKAGPPIIHASSTDGRAGTFICAVILLQQLHSQSNYIDVFGTVLSLRKSRTDLVNNKNQLEFLYRFMSYCVAMTAIVDCPMPTLPEVGDTSSATATEITVKATLAKTRPAGRQIIFKRREKCFFVISDSQADKITRFPLCSAETKTVYAVTTFSREGNKLEVRWNFSNAFDLLSKDIVIAPELGRLEVFLSTPNSLTLHWLASSTTGLPDHYFLLKVNGARNINVSMVTSDSIQVSWEPSDDDGSANYRYYAYLWRDTVDGGSREECVIPPGMENLLCTFKGLQPNTDHFFVVTTCTPLGYCNHIETPILTGKLDVGEDDGKLSIENIGSDAVRISWRSAAVSDDYVFRVIVDGNRSILCPQLSAGDKHSCYVCGLQGDRTYTMQVFNCTPTDDLNRCHPYTSPQTVTTPPGSPQNVTVVALSSDSMNIAWTAPNDDNYDTYDYSVDIRTGKTDFQQCQVYAGDDKLSCDFHELQPGAIYTIAVKTSAASGTMSTPSLLYYPLCLRQIHEDRVEVGRHLLSLLLPLAGGEDHVGGLTVTAEAALAFRQETLFQVVVQVVVGRMRSNIFLVMFSRETLQ